MCRALPSPMSTRFIMTVPSTLRLLLMADPSFWRTPEDFVPDCRSDPARSTRLMREVKRRPLLRRDLVLPFLAVVVVAPAVVSLGCTSSSIFPDMQTVKTAWDRLLVLFILVDAMVRDALPLAISSNASSGLFTTSCLRPSTKGPVFLSSLRRREGARLELADAEAENAVAAFEMSCTFNRSAMRSR